VDTNEKEMRRGFCNYFGVGIDARICYSVEKRRQANKWINLALYGCIGCCKLFQGIRSTRDAVRWFRTGEEGDEVKKEDVEGDERATKEEEGKVRMH
jgi:hypothetical protein